MYSVRQQVQFIDNHGSAFIRVEINSELTCTSSYSCQPNQNGRGYSHLIMYTVHLHSLKLKTQLCHDVGVADGAVLFLVSKVYCDKNSTWSHTPIAEGSVVK